MEASVQDSSAAWELVGIQMPCQQVVSLEYEGVEETTAATEIGTVTLPNPLSVYQSISGMRLRAAMSWSSAGLKLDPEA